MNPLRRFFRFNLVGILGIATQLTMLTILDHAFPRHYLVTSTAAVELTLLHNFVWHLHYTWPAEPPRRAHQVLAQFLRFHLSNGLISLLGNLVMMRIFVHVMHARILLANALAIAGCGLSNFLIAHHWVFSRDTQILTLISTSSDN